MDEKRGGVDNCNHLECVCSKVQDGMHVIYLYSKAKVNPYTSCRSYNTRKKEIVHVFDQL